MSAVKRLCTALAMLIRLCDDITSVSLRADAGNEELDTSTDALSPEHVSSVVKGVTTAVEEVASLAQQHMTRPALSPRPALVSPRASSTQRNSLPGALQNDFSLCLAFRSLVIELVLSVGIVLLVISVVNHKEFNLSI